MYKQWRENSFLLFFFLARWYHTSNVDMTENVTNMHMSQFPQMIVREKQDCDSSGKFPT